MLAGFHAMDEHFRTAPPERNLPMLMGLLTIWYNNFFGAETVGVMPYSAVSRAFSRLSAAADRWRATASTSISTARHVDYQTGPMIWGEPGTDGQHSFYQLIHQGTKLIPCDFIGFCRPLSPLGGQHDLLMANCSPRPKRSPSARPPRSGGGRIAAGADAVPRLRGQSADQRRFWPNASTRTRSARSSRSTSTTCSRRGRSGTSIRSINGASSSARFWPIASRRNWRLRPSRRFATTARPTT